MGQLWEEDEVDTPLRYQCTECGGPIALGQGIYQTPGMPDRYSHKECRWTVLDVAFKSAGL